MEKRALLAVALSLLVWIVWLRFFAPIPPPPGEPGPEAFPEQMTGEPVAQRPDQGPGGQRPEEPETAAGTGRPAFEPVVAAVPAEIVLDTPVYRLTLSNRGGVVTSWILKDYFDEEGEPLETVSPATVRLGRYPLSLGHPDPAIDETLNTSLYAVEREAFDPGGGAGERVTFRYSDGQGIAIEKVLDVGPGYLSRFTVVTRGLEGAQPIEVGLGPGFGVPEEGKEKNRFFVRGQAILLGGGGLTKIPRTRVKEEETRVEPGPFAWGGLEDTYFGAVLVAEQGLPAAVLRSHRIVERGVAREYLHVAFPLDRPEGAFSLFVGPKDLEILKPLGNELARLVDFRPRFIAPIARGLLVALKFIHRGIGNYGWAIVVLTVAIKVLFFPLTQRSSVSMRRMQQKMKKVQPRIQSIKDRWQKQRKDPQWRQKMNQELMGLYQKEGINPLGSVSGCLPLLLQLPILYGLFSLLSVAIELRQAPFIFWLTDLSQKDPYYITPIVMGLTMFVQQRMSTPVGTDPMQRRMMMMMPLMFTFFFVKFPSGLVLYWLVSNLLGIGQQYLINLQAERIGMKELGARHGKLQRVSR